MMNCLITGANGFVGNHLIRTLETKYSKIFRIGLSGDSGVDKDLISLDIRDENLVDSIIQETMPDVIFHLAAQPFVPRANKNPQETLEINVKGTLNFLHSLSKLKKIIKFIYISSADVYGNQEEKNYPLSEEFIPHPVNPYSASKLAAEIYCKQYSLQFKHLQVIIARPFNHIGIGQREEFVVPNFIKQVLEAKKKNYREIFVGNLSSKRDFLDVRDVVRAYSILAECGIGGEIYNICSGKEISIREILEKIIQIVDAKISISVDPTRFREAETPRLFGSPEKLQKLGWSQEVDLDISLKTIIQNYIL